MAALANLLPGIRDVRAPLAAGYIWLLGLWLALERSVPGEDDADGLLESVYRLGDGLSAIGLGVVASFVAYVLGALSTSLFAAPSSGLRKLRGLSRLLRLDPFSAQTREALRALGRNTRVELEGILSMSGTDVDELLHESHLTEPDPPRRNLKIFPAAAKRRRVAPIVLDGPGGPPPDYDVEQEASIARAVTRDLDTIATTRLLGRDQELYSAVDRLRAEMEFRRAIVPPLVFGAGVVVLRTDLPESALAAAIVTALSLGLLLDAARLERRMNDLLLDAVTDDRVQSPTLERLRSRALAIVGRTAADDTERVASRLAAAIKRTIRRLEMVGKSEPLLADQAKRDAILAQTVLNASKASMPPATLELAQELVTALDGLADAWVSAMRGEPSDVEEARAVLGTAEDGYQRFLKRAKHDIAAMRESGAVPA